MPSAGTCESPEDALNRLYVVESLMTVTGFSADHRLRVPAARLLQVAGALAAADAGQTAALPGAGQLGDAAGVDAEVGCRMREGPGGAHRANLLVVAGHRQPLAVHLLAHAMNAALGNIGKTVVFHEVPEPPRRASPNWRRR